MKLGKKLKKEAITNPFRPKTGLKRKYTICKVTMDSSLLKDEESHLSMQVDADDEPTFVREVESLVPSKERYRDGLYEMWFIEPKHRELVLDLAQDYFNEILIVENGKFTKIKGKFS